MAQNWDARDFLVKALVHEEAYPPDLDEVRSAMLNELGGIWAPLGLTTLRPDIIDAFVHGAGDPEVALSRWLWHGALVGALELWIAIPSSPHARCRKGAAQLYCTSPPDWTNYTSVEMPQMLLLVVCWLRWCCGAGL
eukprot:5627328-Amphidinium_carterae.1